MYKQPELTEYQDKWLQAEKDLAIRSWEIWGLFPLVQEELAPTESNNEPIERPKQNKGENHLTKSDFIRALKRASQRVDI